MGPDDPQFPHTFDELLVHVEHHLEADEAQMFPVVEAARTRQPSARPQRGRRCSPSVGLGQGRCGGLQPPSLPTRAGSGQRDPGLSLWEVVSQ